MSAISNRQPPFDIEYDLRGKRVRKHFENAHAGRAFYQLKLNAGKSPRVRRPEPIHVPYYVWEHRGVYAFNWEGREYKATTLPILQAQANKFNISLHPYCG